MPDPQWNIERQLELLRRDRDTLAEQLKKAQADLLVARKTLEAALTELHECQEAR